MLPKLLTFQKMLAPSWFSSMVAQLRCYATWSHPIAAKHLEPSSTVLCLGEWSSLARAPWAEAPMTLGPGSTRWLRESTKILDPCAWQLPLLQWSLEKILKTAHMILSKLEIASLCWKRVENASLFRTPQWVQPPQPWAWLLLGLSAHEWMNENELQKNKTWKWHSSMSQLGLAKQKWANNVG